MMYSSYTVGSETDDIMMGVCVIFLILSCIFGLVTLGINEKKGYEGGFAWGFWLGVIGIVVVACRQSEYGSGETYSFEKASYGLSQGKWRCSCGRYNADNMSSCVCGCNKRDLLQSRAEKPEVIPSGNAEVSQETEALKEYKELLTQEIITQEEFEMLKKTIPEQ